MYLSIPGLLAVQGRSCDASSSPDACSVKRVLVHCGHAKVECLGKVKISMLNSVKVVKRVAASKFAV